MKIAFEKLKVGDEFADDNGIKYKKINDSFYQVNNAMIIDENPILHGIYVKINQSYDVNKIFPLKEIGNLNVGDVIRLPNTNYAIKLCYELDIDRKGNCFTQSIVLDMTQQIVFRYSSIHKFEHVGHISLKWPPEGSKT